jgi:hypothetical protein
MGGAPPAGAVQKSRAALQRHAAAQAKATKLASAEASRLAEPMRKLVFGHIPRDDAVLTKNMEATRALCEQRSKRKRRAPKLEKFEASITVGSIQAIKVPPYDADWAPPAPKSGAASANKGNGSYHLAAQSLGDGSIAVSAGVAVWFFSPGENLQQRCAALLDYSDDWWDMASGYVAHNDLRTRIWIWGAGEQRWVNQADVSPQWSDGVGWWEAHGNDPQGDDARISVQTFFPARASSWYLAWVWSNATIYADSGFWGFAASSVHFDASVPLLVFGSL